jgi:hypothetical protein
VVEEGREKRENVKIGKCENLGRSVIQNRKLKIFKKETK